MYGYSPSESYTNPNQTNLYVYDLLGLGMHLIGSKLYMFNGFNPLDYSMNEFVYRFDIETNNWEIISNLATCNCLRGSAYIASHNGDVWYAGGRDNTTSYNTIIHLNFSEMPIVAEILSKNWVNPEARENHGMYLINTQILLFGGEGLNG